MRVDEARLYCPKCLRPVESLEYTSGEPSSARAMPCGHRPDHFLNGLWPPDRSESPEARP